MAGRRIVQVVGSLQMGGAERYVVTLSGLLKDQGCEVWICVLSGERTALTAKSEESGIGFLEITGGGGNYYAGGIRRLVPLLRRLRVDVVHSHVFQPSVIGRIAARLSGVPVIVTTEHGPNLWKTRSHILAERVLTRITDVRICNSGYTRGQRLLFRESPPEKLKVIWNGVERNFAHSAGDGGDVRASLGIGKGEKVVGTIGRLTGAKGIEYLIEATPHLGSRNLRVLIVGDGPDRERLERLAEQLRLSQKIVFAGARHDVAAVLMAMDIFVMPSVRESFGIAAVEAMACGRPVVASAVGGIPEVVSQNEAGLLVAPGDVQGLARAICTLLNDEARSREMGRRGRERFLKYFTAERNAVLVRQCYEDILRKKRAA